MRFIKDEFMPQYHVPSRYKDDVFRIQHALWNINILSSMHEAYTVWEKYSGSMCAGWMSLPETDEEIIALITENAEDGNW